MLYSRQDIRKEMLLHSKNREISIRYGDHFGSRPDVLKYPAEIEDAAKNNATSFHVSVERWSNPMRLSTNLKKDELDTLRTGWDLLFDIDIPDIGLSKILAHLIVKALRDNKISCPTIKFSGNKGFHIGVPFEVFPSTITIGNKKIKTSKFFPDGPIKISRYIMDFIESNYTRGDLNVINFDIEENDPEYIIKIDKVKEAFKDKFKEREDLRDKLIKYHCSACNIDFLNINQGKMIELICPVCSRTENVEYNRDIIENENKCKKCGNVLDKKEYYIKDNKPCRHVGNEYFKDKIETRFNFSLLLEVDRQIFSSRHMYRMPYSLHEKSGLVSIPFNPDKIMKFEKKYAKTDRFKISRYRFLDPGKAKSGEGAYLLTKALEYKVKEAEEKKPKKIYDDFTLKIPKELFPPCIKKGLLGLDDGKKRFLFALRNFLVCCNYPHDEVEEICMEWNKKNGQELKQNIIIGQLKYSKKRNEKMLPPNCFYPGGSGFYLDLGICEPDNFCKKIKNPFNYSKLKGKNGT